MCCGLCLLRLNSNHEQIKLDTTLMIVQYDMSLGRSCLSRAGLADRLLPLQPCFDYLSHSESVPVIDFI